MPTLVVTVFVWTSVVPFDTVVVTFEFPGTVMFWASVALLRPELVPVHAYRLPEIAPCVVSPDSVQPVGVAPSAPVIVPPLTRLVTGVEGVTTTLGVEFRSRMLL